jgi:hypothetical protein
MVVREIILVDNAPADRRGTASPPGSDSNDSLSVAHSAERAKVRADEI